MSDSSSSMGEIKNFNEFLEKCLEYKVLNYTIRALTKAGDNYRGVVQSVEVRADNNNNKVNAKKRSEFNWLNPNVFLNFQNEVLHLIAKTVIVNPLWNEMFQPFMSFEKEAHFYTEIIPIIEQFEQNANVPQDERIDMFIRCFGCRTSLDPSKYLKTFRKFVDSMNRWIISDSKSADSDAVLLLENVKSLNFHNIDRHTGFDADETFAVIKVLKIIN